MNKDQILRYCRNQEQLSMRTIESIAERQKTGKDNVAKAIITTSNLDRHGSIIESRGIDTSFFMENPVILYSHGRDVLYGNLPIGRAIDLEIHNKSIIATWQWATPDENERAKFVKNQWESGLLQGVSIGFIPLEWEEIEPKEGEKPVSMWGLDVRITKSELVEASVVPTPSNRQSLKRDNDYDFYAFTRHLTDNFDKYIKVLESHAELSNTRLEKLEQLLEKAILITPTAQPAPMLNSDNPLDQLLDNKHVGDEALTDSDYDQLVRDLNAFIAASA